jgi:hypothetical protein
LRIVLEKRIGHEGKESNAGNAGKAFGADNKGFQSLQLYMETRFLLQEETHSIRKYAELSL